MSEQSQKFTVDCACFKQRNAPSRSAQSPTERRSAEMKDHRLTVGYIYANAQKVPALRLSGKWLEQIGFESDRKVIVKQLPGQLVIQLAEEATI